MKSNRDVAKLNSHDPNSRNVTVRVIRGRGRGCFALRKIRKGETIERAPVIVVPGKEWRHAEKTKLSNYAFDWGAKNRQAAIALGYISIYNHSFSPNALLQEMPEGLMMEIVALKDIRAGEEIFINYNGEPDSRDPLWFRVRGAGK